MASLTTFGPMKAVPELTGATYAVTFIDGSGAALDADAITAIACTLTDVASGEPVNSREAQDVHNANDGVLASDGTFTLSLRAADHAIADSTPEARSYVHRRLTLRVTYTRADSVSDTLHHQVEYLVRALADVPMGEA